MSDRETPPPKKDVARALLLRGSVFVYLDPRRDGVRVPPWLCKQPQLVLQVGLDLPVPIPDLKVDDAGVYGTLSFNRAPFTCSVPWEAVFALVGDDAVGMVWHEDLPEEVAAEVEEAYERDGKEPPKAPATRARRPGPKLRAIEGGAAKEADRERDDESSGGADSEPPDGDGGGNGDGGLPPYLRVIK